MLTEHSIDGVHGDLVLCGVPDETLSVGECHVGWSRAVSLVIGDDLDSIVLPDPDARVGSAEINADRWSLSLAGHFPRSDRYLALWRGEPGKNQI